MTTATKTIKEQIEDAIEVEADEPAATVIEVLKTFEGKQFGKIVVAAINEALGLTGSFRPFMLCKDHRMTQLKWWGAPNNSVFNLLICYETTHVMVDTADIIERNPAYFSAKDDRNAKRSKATADKIYRLVEAADAFRVAQNCLREILDNDAFEPDYHKLKEIVGLSKPSR